MVDIDGNITTYVYDPANQLRRWHDCGRRLCLQ
ncbi:MAG: hypothetical protein K8T91_08215 [Planctomycetes bacterium]|nr:hypothetical protein [Planctomycetota bacterium]